MKMMTTTTEKIWNDFNKELLRFIKKRVKDNDAANDLLQEVFIKIHLKLPTLKNNDRIGAWAYQITRNSILDYYKKSKHKIDGPSNVFQLEETELYNNDFVKCLKPFINQLPEDYRDAIVQTELGQLSQKQFAEKLNISYSGAKSRIQRARQQLLRLFNQCCKASTDKYGNILEYQRGNNCNNC